MTASERATTVNEEKHIAAQALNALQLRRQLDRGELTHVEYLAGLEAQEGSPLPAGGCAPQATAEPGRETDGSKSRQMKSELRPKLSNALEALQLQRRLEHGQLMQQEYLTELQGQPGTANLRMEETAPIDASSPTAPSARPVALVIVTTQAVPERFLTMKCPRCEGSLSIYDRMMELQCNDCGSDIVVERKNCTIELRLDEDLLEEQSAIAALAASSKRNEELKKLRARIAWIPSVVIACCLQAVRYLGFRP